MWGGGAAAAGGGGGAGGVVDDGEEEVEDACPRIGETSVTIAVDDALAVVVRVVTAVGVNV